MLAEQALDELKYFVQSGLDGYVFDYRGYGRNRHGKIVLEPYLKISLT